VTDIGLIELRREVFMRILGSLPFINTDKNEKLVIERKILQEAAKEANKIVDILTEFR